MFSLETHGGQGGVRLIAEDQLTPGDFDAIAGRLKTVPMRARKAGFVSARPALFESRITTHWNGEETVNTAKPGDYVAANLSPARAVLRDKDGNPNLYVIGAARFSELYEAGEGATEFGAIYRARGIVEAVFLPGGFEIMAPWGEVQRAGSGYLLKSGDEIYGNAKATFEETYQRI